MGGKSKKVTVGFRYYLGMHLAVSRTAWDALRAIRAGGRVAWQGYQAVSGQIYVNAPKLFGGDKKEGGVQGYMDVMMGEPTQGVNDYLAAKIGGLMPAFRGFFSLVWRGGQVAAINPYMKPWLLEGTRILSGWGRGECWYPEKAEIERPGATPARVLVSTHVVNINANDMTGKDGGDAVTITDVDPTHIVSIEKLSTVDDPDLMWEAWSPWNADDSITPLPPPVLGQTWFNRFFIADESNNEIYAAPFDNGGNLWATAEEALNEAIAETPVELTGHTTYKFYDFDPNLGDNRGGLSLRVNVYQEIPGFPDMNPAHIVYQLATDPDLEMRYPEADIDEDSFTAAADTFYDEGMGLTLSWNRQTKIRDFIKIVLDHAGANFYADPFTGKFVLKPIRFDYDPDTLDVYDEDDIVAIEEYQRPGYGEAINQVIVRYRDRINHVNAATPPWQDLASIQAQGRVIGETIEYPGFSHAAIAIRVAARDGKALSARLAKAKIRMKRSLWRGAPAGVIKVNWAKLGLAGVIFRIVEINTGTLESGEIVVTVVQDEFGLPSSSYAAEQPSGWTPPDVDPSPITMQDVLEAPYWDIARTLSAADLDYFDDDGAFALTLAATANQIETGYTIHTRIDPAEYEEVGEGGFVATAVTSGAVTRDQTVISYTSAISIDDVVVGQRVLIGTGRPAEWAELVDIDTDAQTVTLSRGILDTTPQEFEAGTRIWFASEDDVGLDPTERATAEEVDVKLTAATGAGETEVDDATEMSIVFDQRFFRPYAPGKLRINGEAFPDSIDEALEFTWAHRDRVQQTAGYISQDEDSIGPEDGTTYVGRLYDDDTDALLLEETGITGTTWEPAFVGSYRIRLELSSVRDGVESWQAQVRVFDFGFSSRITEDDEARETEDGEARIPETGDSLAGGGEEEGVYYSAMVPEMWDGTQFVAQRLETDAETGGQSVYVWTSTDGTSWTKRGSSIGFVPNGIAFGGGIYVAVKGPWFGYTSDLDTPWTSFTITTWPDRGVGGGIGFSRPIHDGTQFISSGSHGLVIVSTDGATWTEVGTESLGPDFTVGAISYDGSGTYVANVGDDGEYKMFSSSDLETWSEGTYTPDGNNPNGYVGTTKFQNGKFFLIGGKSNAFASSIPMLLESDDGDTWTECSFTTSGSYSKTAKDLVYFDGLYVVGGQNCNAYSADLSSWTVENINSPTPATTRQNLASSGDEVTAVERRGTSSVTNHLMRSTDGMSWSEVTL